MRMKLLLRFSFIISVLTLFNSSILGQGVPVDPLPCYPPPCVPITDHIGWLIAALVGFGILKTIQYSRNASVQS